jgi:hypothetical protein
MRYRRTILRVCSFCRCGLQYQVKRLIYTTGCIVLVLVLKLRLVLMNDLVE